MGTKRIDEALTMLRAVSGAGIIKAAVEDAEHELEAIRKAARALSANAHPTNKETGIALALMDDIAKEGP